MFAFICRWILTNFYVFKKPITYFYFSLLACLSICIIPSKANYIYQVPLLYAQASMCMCVQVAGAAVIFEVQRSSRSEARKEELRKQQLEVMWPCSDSSFQLYLISVDCLPENTLDVICFLQFIFTQNVGQLIECHCMHQLHVVLCRE